MIGCAGSSDWMQRSPEVVATLPMASEDGGAPLIEIAVKGICSQPTVVAIVAVVLTPTPKTVDEHPPTPPMSSPCTKKVRPCIAGSFGTTPLTDETPGGSTTSNVVPRRHPAGRQRGTEEGNIPNHIEGTPTTLLIW